MNLRRIFCCAESFGGDIDFQNHYINYHGVDESNNIFKKLSTRNRNFCPRKCFHCNYFCLNKRDEKNHNFLFHYQLGGRQLIEDNPIKIVKYDENLPRFCINLNEHSDFYDFFDS